jgi:hypothetical protein
VTLEQFADIDALIEASRYKGAHRKKRLGPIAAGLLAASCVFACTLLVWATGVAA